MSHPAHIIMGSLATVASPIFIPQQRTSVRSIVDHPEQLNWGIAHDFLSI